MSNKIVPPLPDNWHSTIMYFISTQIIQQLVDMGILEQVNPHSIVISFLDKLKQEGHTLIVPKSIDTGLTVGYFVAEVR